VSGDNGGAPESLCAEHDLSIQQQGEAHRVLVERVQSLEAERIRDQEHRMLVSRQASAAAVAGKGAAEKSQAAVNATLALSGKVDTLTIEVHDGFGAMASSLTDLAGRVRDLEHPARRRDDPRPPLPSNLDHLSPSKIEALDPDLVVAMRELYATKERLAAAEAALATRERHSDRVAAAEKDDTDAQLKRLALANAKLEIRNKRLTTLAGIVITAITVLGGIATAYFAAGGH
jgi:hypothetical protein